MNRSTHSRILDIGLFAKPNMLSAGALVLTMLICFLMSFFVFKQKSIGGFAWVLPLLVAATTGVFIYRQHCIKFGVLTDRESLDMGRNMAIWTLLVMLPVYGLAQKSMSSGVASLFMAVPIYGVLMLGGVFVVKTMLLVQNYDERGRDAQLNADDVAKIVADYRRDKGINDMPRPDMPQPGANQGAAQATTQYDMPRSSAPMPTAPISVRSNTAQNVSNPGDEDDIRRKIHEVRARALKAARRAEKAAQKPPSLRPN